MDDVEDVPAPIDFSSLTWSIEGLAGTHPHLSAKHTLSACQRAGGVAFMAVVVAAFIVAPLWSGIAVMASITALYTAVLGMRIDLMIRGHRARQHVKVPDQIAFAVPEDQLPCFTVLVPAYHESELLPALVANLAAFDYPRDRLEIKLLLEADDGPTIAAAIALDLHAPFEVMLVPVAEPRTKPKALNYALTQSRGDIITVYDAEDRPDPMQLRQVAAIYHHARPDVVCVQAQLAFFNADENLITRWFATEYAVWFTQFLPALASVNAAIPLGGTSNHIRRDVLLALGGWDPYNVTEDADLGIRLRRTGYRVAVLDSVTFEEANTDFINWVKQRSRWYKGYAQTWLVHMRQPLRLLRELGVGGFLRFNLFVGGTPLLALLNPMSWVLLLMGFTLRPDFVRDIMPTPIYYAGLACWIVGNFTFYYLNLLSAYGLKLSRIFRAALLLPGYWVMMALAAAKALVQLVFTPNLWEKTQHGLTRHDVPGAATKGAK